MMEEQKSYRLYICTGTHCRGRGCEALHQQLEQELWERQLDTLVELRGGGCQDQCDYGPNLIVWPGPYRYAGLNSAAIIRIVAEHLEAGEPVEAYLATPEMRR